MKHGKRDSNHGQVKRALLAVGGWVVDTSEVGDGCPDLYAVLFEKPAWLEIKSPTGRIDKGQAEWHARCRAAGVVVYVVRSPAEALAIWGIGVTR